MKLTDQQQRIVNNNMRLLEVGPRSGSHINCFKYHPQNSKEHEEKKFKIFVELRDMGYPVMTEAIFENGCRADIINMLSGDIIEVLHTETFEEAKEKVKSYPSSFNVTFIQTDTNKEKYGKMRQ